MRARAAIASLWVIARLASARADGRVSTFVVRATVSPSCQVHASQGDKTVAFVLRCTAVPSPALEIVSPAQGAVTVLVNL